ncbi:hypothetical protein KP509_02G095600 [Ceratopteris richardii]|uniref:Uncharacterized protein n=1 Tax=Ceratopteris richardii TaxID=49495 RepID=A0A8T2V8T8_CERRI|nr:hypothetical protein KP509_02G095600 [Ceratopteris richardii]
MAISAEEMVARNLASPLAAAFGTLSSMRLMPGSSSTALPAVRDPMGVVNDHNPRNNMNRDLINVRGDLAGLYPAVPRLGSGGPEGGLLLNHPALVNVDPSSGNLARSGINSGMLSFVGGEFRLHNFGRAYNAEEGADASSMQPLLTSASQRTEGPDSVAPSTSPRAVKSSWQQGDPPAPRIRSTIEELENVETRAMTRKDSPGLSMAPGEVAREQHLHQLALVQVNKDVQGVSRGNTTELQSQTERCGSFEPQQGSQRLRELGGRSESRTIVPEAVGAEGASSGSTACQDCGNQAKKDCVHMRCRTCCRSRGFECSTHVKSTWVPVSKRRQRQLQQAGLLACPPGNTDHQHYQESWKLSRLKRARTCISPTAMGATSASGILGIKQLHHRHHHLQTSAAGGEMGTTSRASSSTGTPPRSSDMNSGPSIAAFPTLSQEGHEGVGVFPPEFKAEALFRCLRISRLSDAHEEYGYQTEIKIGGHIFKGILHDQGAERRELNAASIAELHLGGRNIQTGAAGPIDLSGMYGSMTTGSAMLGGFQQE